MKKIAQIILTVLGWRINGSFPKLDNYVAVVAPHRTWKDFVIGLLVKWVSVLPPLRFGFKYEYTKVPVFHHFLLSLGGIAIDRNHILGGPAKGEVTKILLEVVSGKKPGMVALAPEGTRKAGAQWRMGFYHITTSAKAPLVMVAFDYQNKKIWISDPLVLTGNWITDFENIKDWYGLVVPDYEPIM